ncbi:unnamed protein product [Arctogadus glacialis]
MSPGLTMTMFGLFYFQDGSVRAENTSVIRDAYRNKKITVNCREDLESEQGWIEVIWPTQRRQQEAKPIAAKLLFVGEVYQELAQKRDAFSRGEDIWSVTVSQKKSRKTGNQAKEVETLRNQATTSGSQAATSMCDQLKSYLHSKRTAKQSTPLRSSTPAPDWSDDSDETSCDLFGPFKMRKVVLTSEEEGDDCIPQEEPEHQKEPEGQQQPVKVLVELEEETLKALKELPGLVAAIKTALEKLPSACTSSTLSQSDCQQTPGSDTSGDDLGEDNCFYGTLLPTLETLISKTLDLKSGLQILGDLPEAVVKAIKTRFAEVLECESAVLAAVTLPRFKLRWLRTQERKDNAKMFLCNSAVQVSKRLFNRIDGRRLSLFTQELATMIFGKETLAKSTLTGKGKKGEAKDQLDPEKVEAIIDMVREKFPNTMVSEIRALLRRKCNNEGYTKVAPQ